MSRRAGRLFTTLFVIAVAANFVWEMAQSVLFAPMGGWVQASSRCAAASVGDGVIVVIIAAAGSVAFRRADWFDRPGAAGYLFIAVLGAAVAALVEWRSLSTGRWAYGEAMPLIPAVNVGLAPVLQMVVLPPLVLALTARYCKTTKG
jgi:hypothetical protein